MSLFCRETALSSKLKSMGFNPVALPQESLDPLILMEVEGNSLVRIGNLKDIIHLENLKFSIQKVVELEGFKTSKVSISAGFSYLSKVSPLLNGLGINSKFGQIEDLRYMLSNVSLHSIDRSLIIELINESIYMIDSQFVLDKLFSNDLYLVTDVLKSNKVLLVEEFSSNLGNDSSKESSNKINFDLNASEKTMQSFESVSPITFAIKAYKLVFDKKKLISFKKDNKVYRSADTNYLLAFNYGHRYWNMK